jgi:hypothetical protein
MAFWKKIFKSKYTGAEIDAAVAKAGNLPAVTSADAGKALVVDEEGHIVTGEAGGSGAFIVNAAETPDTFHLALDKTYQEIAAAYLTMPVLILWRIPKGQNNYIYWLTQVDYNGESTYSVTAISSVNGNASTLTFECSDVSDYPMAEID